MANNKNVIQVAPLLKWPGGKRELLPLIIPHFPRITKMYIEPFVGGGAVFAALQPNKVRLNDLNKDLINCYKQIRDRPLDVIRSLSRWRNSEPEYYRVRALKPRTEVSRAARLIFLCTLSFNGIYRVNLKGYFNVPYGYKTHLSVCNKERIINFSKLLQGSELTSLDFEQAISSVCRGDTVYFDPPYTTSHSKNGFLKYNEKIFSWSDQLRLAEVTKQLDNLKCHVIVSNAWHPSIRRLYSHLKAIKVTRFSRIAASASYRSRVNEYLFISGSS